MIKAYNKRKIFNDPVYGFISIKHDLIHDLIEHPYFQRLRNIHQLGMTHLVYPGALHTRFHHALGAMHLMNRAIETLRNKGVEITEKEAIGATAAILLHDIGHGPFSHALENTFIEGISHEAISLAIMKEINRQWKGKLDTCIAIFENQYPKKFLHQLVSSQLDMDRLDYLKRDSFYTGVSEGVISTDRIISMLTLHEDNLAVEEKGIYSVEKFIIARRLMYWQVYLHKTVIAAENLIINILKRAKELASKNKKLFATPALQFFLYNQINKEDWEKNSAIINHFVLLDDYDIMASIKVWTQHNDPVLSDLSKRLIYRNLYKIKIQNTPFDNYLIKQISENLTKKYKWKEEWTHYYIVTGTIQNNAYNPQNDKINILKKDGTVYDIADAADLLNIWALSEPVTKFFLCTPEKIDL
ncbi:MAG: phosphohydrolase [Vicingaceae bacterium]|nr:MAG: phosphohydrolase [Vicingaceae bacterium]